jgi:hypothetical protein
VIANSVPQIATVKRSAARLEIAYDGAPQFRPIPGTSLEAAANAPVPVIRVEGRTYYALDNGVWFFSESAEGPWIAATSVPPAIYTIPRSHPLHYVTYVRVYDAEGDDVYVGYTPGYVGSYATPESTVVYGTGWDYTPWVGTVWYAAPVTWGFGFSFYYSWWNPWPWRASWPAWRPVPCFRPAWGPWPHAHVGVKTSTVAIVAPARWHGARIHGRGAFHDSPAVAGGIYRRWDSRSVPNVSSHRFSARGDTRPSFRGVDRGALSGPPHSPERDGRAPWRERNQWSGERQRSHVDPPRWARPDGRRDRTSSWDRTVQSFDPSPRRMQPPGAAPARTPPGADQPRSPGLWRGAVPSHRHGGAIEPRAHAPDRTRAAEGRQRGRQDDRGWARRDSAWPRGSLDAAPASPRSMQQQPFRPAAAGPRAADRMREFRAAPRQRAAQPSTGGPRVSGPALSR